MKLALYGGSFDPPHAGHVAVVNAALSALAIDRLIVVPASRNPFKPSVRASGEKRVEWLSKLFAAYSKVEVSDFETQQNRSVYTIETVLHYRPAYETVYLIIGADNLEKLREWHRFDELNAIVTWVVATRGDVPIPEGMLRLEVNEPLSSTDFRTNMAPLGLDPAIEAEITTYYKDTHESTY